MLRSPLRLARLLAVAGCAAAVGCLGSYNPSYIPYYLTPGRIEETHAKPRGLGYYRDFDRKACRVEITPTSPRNPVGAQQVLIASVFDKDGAMRRSRRIEWILEGPGNIVEVDESGYFAGRGYKKDNKYGVSYTNYLEHTITRGNTDDRDDFTVEPGQTWCVVTSAVEGQTVVTAYAPEVFDWEKGRVSTTITWGSGLGGPSLPGTPSGPGGIVFPPPVISRAGGELDLTTTASRLKEEGLLVRYKVLDGPATQLASRGTTDPESTAFYSRDGQRAEVPTDPTGRAIVTVRQSPAKAGKTRIAVEVVKPDPDGGPATVVKASETTVEWATADLTLNLELPKVAALGGEVPLTIVVANAGKADGQPVTVRSAIPEGTELVRTEPAAVQQGQTLTWKLDALPGGKSQPLRMVVRPTRKETLTVSASATTPDGLQARQQAGIPVDTAGLKVALEPQTAAPNERATVVIAVTNVGAVPADGTTAWVTLGEGLTSDTSDNPVEVKIGSVPPGQTKRSEVIVRAKSAGRYTLRANVTADGGLSSQVDGSLDVRRSELTATITGPDRVGIGAEGLWEIRVANTGDVAIPNATVRATVPKSLTAKSDSDWALGTLAAGERKSLRLTAVGNQLADRGVIAVSVTGTGGKASAEAPVIVAGQPALTVELTPASGSIGVGRRIQVQVTVRNKGVGPARRVEVAVSGTGELPAVGGTGPNNTSATADQGKAAFRVIDELPAGGTATFLADVEAVKPGPARLVAEVRAEHLAQPLRDEQSAQVVP